MSVTTEQVVIIDRVQLLDNDTEHRITIRDGHVESIVASSEPSKETGPNVLVIDGQGQTAVRGPVSYTHLTLPTILLV